ncbi:MAG TPA: aminotransferase class III-fold pyridoxal phosphate-dependent enzyme, partial [Clostridia bacterium]|nr:aminotransferase class III-fold pyridoxal phosphate-dependent enzyme [Clostridia bacterium]
KRFDLDLVKGQKELLYDSNGKEYIDMGGGIAVNIFGASDLQWKNAVISQLNLIQHTSNLYYTYPQVQLAKLLCKKSSMKKAFFSNSGAEANECAIK